MLITPAKFEDSMTKIVESNKGDVVQMSEQAASLINEVMESLGYESGLRTFREGLANETKNE